MVSIFGRVDSAPAEPLVGSFLCRHLGGRLPNRPTVLGGDPAGDATKEFIPVAPDEGFDAAAHHPLPAFLDVGLIRPVGYRGCGLITIWMRWQAVFGLDNVRLSSSSVSSITVDSIPMHGFGYAVAKKYC